MSMSRKKIKSSSRGLTFSTKNHSAIGTKFRYFINKTDNTIIIMPDENGSGTVSRKKCGKTYNPLYDIRSKEVRELVSNADYLEVVETEESIIVHIYKKVRSKVLKRNIVRIEDVFAQKTGEIVLCKASGTDCFGGLTLTNDEYFASLVDSIPSSYKKRVKRNRKELETVYSVASLFSGAGLLDYAFKDPKFRFVFGVDFDENACMTYRENIGEHILCKDIREIKGKDVPDIDLVIGGPCCQAYSNANRCNVDTVEGEEKRLLVEDYVRLVKEKQVKVFVIENVPQMLTKENGKYLERILHRLPEYDITYTLVTDCEVGGYTKRKRAIVIGSKIGKITLPAAKVHTVKTVKDALEKVDATWFNYEDVTIPKSETEKIMSYVPQGGNWKDVPREVREFGKDTHSDIYRRLAWDEISPTIVNWRKINLTHPDKNRILTVSEAAALMGLDKDFRILGKTLNSKQQQVSNGVTQAIGRFVKKYVLEALEMHTKITSFT